MIVLRACFVSILPVYGIFVFFNHVGMDIDIPVVIGSLAVLIVGWMLFSRFVVNTFERIVYKDDPSYQRFIQSGGDPYFDLTWYSPVNDDSNEVRQTGGWAYVSCPHCGDSFHANTATCPSCGGPWIV